MSSQWSMPAQQAMTFCLHDGVKMYWWQYICFLTVNSTNKQHSPFCNIRFITFDFCSSLCFPWNQFSSDCVCVLFCIWLDAITLQHSQQPKLLSVISWQWRHIGQKEAQQRHCRFWQYMNVCHAFSYRDMHLLMLDGR